MKRNHTREFKLQCCRQVATGQKRPAQLCREHNLSERERAALEMAQGVRGKRRRGLHRETALLSREEALEARIAELERFCGR